MIQSLKRRHLFLGMVVVLYSLLLNSCSIDVAGSGTSTGNAKVVGTLLNEQGKPATQTAVFLIPHGYNPAIEEQGDVVLVDTTDNQGQFEFTFSESGAIYNVYSRSATNSYQSFTQNVVVNNAVNTVHLAPLNEPGAVTVAIDDDVDITNSYLYLPGTLFYLKLHNNVNHIPGKYEVHLKDLPSSELPALYFAREENITDTIRLSDEFTVQPGDTSLIGTYSFDAVYNSSNSSLYNNSIQSLAINRKGTVWIGLRNGLISYFTGEKWATYHNIFLNNPPVYSIEIDKYNSVWSGSAFEIVRYNGQYWQIYNEHSTGGIPFSNVYSIAFDSSNGKWFSKYPQHYNRTGGVVHHNGHRWIEYNYFNSRLPSDFVYAITVDGHGDKWIGSRGGITKIGYGQWTNYHKGNSALPCDTIFSLAVDKEGIVWAGTFSGQIVRLSDWQVFDTTNSSLSGHIVRSITFDSKNNLWCGTSNGILTRYDGHQWRSFSCYNSHIPFLCGSINDIEIDAHDNVWTATEYEGIVVFGNKAY